MHTLGLFTLTLNLELACPPRSFAGFDLSTPVCFYTSLDDLDGHFDRCRTEWKIDSGALIPRNEDSVFATCSRLFCPWRSADRGE